MAANAEHVISIVEAARLIFRTSTPSDGQIHRIYELMKSGALQVHAFRGSPLRWTTTEEALAEFLAAHRVQQVKSSHAAHVEVAEKPALQADPPPPRKANDADETDLLLDVYRGIWRDYFRAVFLRRHAEHRSRAFARAVTAGQALVLLAFVTLAACSVRWAVVLVPPEQKAVERWLKAETDDYAVTRWYPPEPVEGGQIVEVRVEYRYVKDSHRWIHTDRTFRVADGVAAEVSQGD
jgi:hypothetical protein